MASIDYSQIASLYDIYVNTSFDIPFFLEEAKKVSGEVLELMSGTGRVSIPLIKAGIPLTCIDNSPEMLAVFKRKLKRQDLSADVYEMDVCKISLPKKFDLIFMPFHSFAEILSPADQHKTLKSIRQHLSPEGRFICTLHNPTIRIKRINGKKKLVGEFLLDKEQGVLRLWISEQYDHDKRMVHGTQFYNICDNKGILKSKSELKTRFILHTRMEFEELIKSEGFNIAAFYGDYSYSSFIEQLSPFMIWVLA